MLKWRHVAPFLVGMGLALPARAGDLPLDLTWRAPQECPASDVVLRRVEQIVGPSASGASRVEAQASVAREAGAYAMTLETRIADAKDRRVLRAPTCHALAEACAVVLALAIRTLESPDDAHDGGASDAAATAPGDASFSAAPPPVVAATVPRASTSKVAPPVSKASGASVHGVAGTGFAMNRGTLPSVALGFVVAGALRIDAWRLELELTTWFKQHPTFGDLGRVGASFRAAEGQVAGCRVFLVGRIGAGPCIGMRATAIDVEGFGIRRPSNSSALWASTTLGGRGEWRLTRSIGLAIRADLVVPLSPPLFVLGRAETESRIHDPGPVAGQILAVTEFGIF